MSFRTPPNKGLGEYYASITVRVPLAHAAYLKRVGCTDTVRFLIREHLRTLADAGVSNKPGIDQEKGLSCPHVQPPSPNPKPRTS